VDNFVSIWDNSAEYQEIRDNLAAGRPQMVTGLSVLPFAIWAAALFREKDFPLLVLTSTQEEAQLVYDNLLALDPRVDLFPMLELLPLDVYAQNIEVIAKRIHILSSLCRGEKRLVVAWAGAVLRRLAPPDVLAAHQLFLRKGFRYDLLQLSHDLNAMGYEREKLVQIPGTFSLRGSILDVFPIDALRPTRIEFFDDEVESLRYFNPEDQLSQEDQESILLPPGRELPLDEACRKRCAKELRENLEQMAPKLSREARRQMGDYFGALPDLLEAGGWEQRMQSLITLFYPESGNLLDYFTKGIVMMSEADSIRKLIDETTEERQSRYFDLMEAGKLLPSFYDNFLDYNELKVLLNKKKLILSSQIGEKGGFRVDRERRILSRELPSYHNNLHALKEDCEYFRNHGYRVIFTASSQVRIKRIGEIIADLGFPGVEIMEAAFTKGFESSQLKLAVISEKELFAQEKKQRQRRLYTGGEKIEAFIDLEQGDYVVHINQGIGQYMGVVRLDVGDIQRDYLYIRYAGEDKLYLPVDQLDLIQKYLSDDDAKPRLYKLGGGEWQRVKTKVRHAVKDMAGELLQLYAAREAAEGYAFSLDSAWQKEFEDAFPHEETECQLKSTEEIKHDMERLRPMDRLLCGDVGYGKTEVAMRAAFKAVMDGKQVAVLVPTTVLAQQHYRVFKERFAGYPVNIGCLSRFISSSEQKKILSENANGDLDILIGTHRLLSKDVVFKDLGLLVIDEEQRFGVAHKEKIKTMSKQVDVLTLSATPIPRTLHMALVGMRDMSIIETPPLDRHPVQTYVMEYHERLIKDAILREIGRGGQVYFVHNRVYNIEQFAQMVANLVPEATVSVAHGQMKERELERVMMDFVAGESNVLICTTIIESGLDIPNVNTLIVDESDCFGLAQLYQLRGRVGRSQRQAFAYFTYRKDRIITEVARKRLVAIRDFTELGAGFKIAMRDMEIRGAGDILGAQQHGHIAAVGFDMYCRLLQDEIAKQSGRSAEKEKVSTLLELQVDAYIPNNYVEESALKVDIYKRIAAATALEQIDVLREELTDRYGKIPMSVENLLLLGKVKILAQKLSIVSAILKAGKLELRFAADHPIDGKNLVSLSREWGRRLSFSFKKDFIITIDMRDITSSIGKIDLLLRILGQLCNSLEEAKIATDKE